MGGDLAVVEAARVSHGVSAEEASKGTEADTKLINYLVKHRHTSPFEHTTFKFYVKAPLFVRSQWFRHRTWSYNEISGRYVEYTNPEFYMPTEYRTQAKSNRQASEEVTDITFHNYPVAVIAATVTETLKRYNNLINAGVAKEMARMVFPENLYTEFYATTNANNLMHFLSLRNAPDAQWEIQEYARALETVFSEIMPITYKAFVDNGRNI